MSIDSHQIERIKTSWMLNGVQCWAKVAPEENSELMFRRAIITGLDNKREHAFLKYEFHLIQIQQQKEKGPEKVHVRDLIECNQNADNEKYKEGFPDMVSMNVLNEAEILNNVWLRYSKDLIFSYIGPTLIVMNPYKNIEKLFNEKVLQEFQKPAISSNFDIKQHQPHVYAVTTLAYQQLFMNQKNQAIVISGESGAGKTENAKYCMTFLTSLSNETTKQQRPKKKTQLANQLNRYSTMRYSSVVAGSVQDSQYSDESMLQVKDTSIEERILRCNPILEAFGNAKTVRNDNSSRFGKYVRIWIGKHDKRIKGASITNYLLEKSRVTLLSQGERNYHIFYHFLQGLEISQLKAYKLVEKNGNRLDLKYFNYLNQSNVYEISSFPSDTLMINQIIESFEKMEIDSYQQTAIFKVLSAILYIGNIEFDSSTYTDNTPCSIKNKDILQTVSQLLEINQEDKILKSIIFKIRQVGSQVMETPVNIEECKINRDSLARALYDKMFTWIVQSLNMEILPQNSNPSECLSLGLLDIFGFENFKVNSFEQLCINFTNERLQQLYIMYVFKAEEEEFKKEGLKVHSLELSYQDNQIIIDTMDKPPNGIFDLLDESCSLGNSTDEKFYQKVVSTYSKNDFIKIPKIQNMKFSIVHTAKEVEYTAEGFRNKNKDEISTFLDSCIQSSSNTEICSIWQGIAEINMADMDVSVKSMQDMTTSMRGTMKKVENKGKAQKFLGAKFRAQMKDLMGELNSCDVHFIRCIKPNEDKVKEKFVSQYVLLQIRYLGILESIKVRREGFPCRMSYEEFYTKYHELDIFNRKIPLQRHIDMKQDMPGLCRELLFRVVKDVNKKEVLFGQTKLYLKVQPSTELDNRLIKWWQYKNDQAGKIQGQWEVYNNRKVIKQNLKMIKNAVKTFVKLQAIFKMKVQKKAYLKTLQQKKGIEILQRIQKKMQQAKLKEVMKLWVDKIKMQKKGDKWSNAVSKVCTISKRNYVRDIKEYWLRWKNFIKSEQEKELEKKKKEQEVIIIEQSKAVEEQKQIQKEEVEEEEKKDEVKELEEVKPQEPAAQKKVNPNGLKMEREDIKSDEFTSQGLKIWPNVSNFTKPYNLQNKFSIPNDILDNNQKYQNPQEPEQKDVSNLEYSDQFLQIVQQSSFLEYCNNNVKRAKNFNKKMQIAKIMQFQTSNLNESLLQKSDSFNQDATKIFRSLLKISGNRNSRFSPRYHSDLILNLCYGRDSELDPNCYVMGKKVENPEDQKGQKNRRESKDNKELDQRRGSQLQNYSSQVCQKQNGNSADPNQQDDDLSQENKLEFMANQILNDDLNHLRDEVYFQICKQIAGNKSQEAKKNLFKFAAEMSNLFRPSQDALYPLINFFMEQSVNDPNAQNKEDAKYIVSKLSEFARGYEVLKQVNPSEYAKLSIIKVLKENDPLELQLQKNNNQNVFLNYINKMQPRQLIPSHKEVSKIHNRQQICIKIYLFDGTYIWVPAESLETVKSIVEKACANIDMKERYQFFSLYEVLYEQEKVVKEAFLFDRVKIMDVYNSHQITTELQQKKHSKNIEFRIYLRIRIYYKLFKDDIDSINMFYMQNIFEVNQGRLPLTENQIAQLAAHYCYSSLKTQQNDSNIESVINKAIPQYTHKKYDNKQFINEVSEIYKKLEYKNILEARWMYLEIIRPHDLFLSYQFECRMYVQEKTEQGYKLIQNQMVVLGIRPLQIVISDQDRKTIQIIDFSEMTKWGQSISSNSYFLIQHENSNLYVFEVQDVELADYLINAYVNWKLERNLDDASNLTYSDVITFLVSDKDKENQIK
ncbi:hypothetical protein ABPG74_022169 [Tetrahymena malaccensis]